MVANAKKLLTQRNSKRSDLQLQRAELQRFQGQEGTLTDEHAERQRAYEDALAKGKDVPSAKAGLDAAIDAARANEARCNGLERSIAQLEGEERQLSIRFAEALTAIARVACDLQREETLRHVRAAAKSHRRWHALARAAAVVASEAHDDVREPVVYSDPGPAALRGAIQDALIAEGILVSWSPKAGAVPPLSAEEILREFERIERDQPNPPAAAE